LNFVGIFSSSIRRFPIFSCCTEVFVVVQNGRGVAFDVSGAFRVDPRRFSSLSRWTERPAGYWRFF
jgi:hypothetical protein